MKKTAALGILLFGLTICLSLNPSFVKADVGEVPSESGLITPGDKNDSIEMTYEKVVFDIKDGDGNSPFYQEEFSDTHTTPYAHIKAEFKMTNTSTEDESIEVIFPIPTQHPDLEYFTEDSRDNQALNFVVLINSLEVDYEYEVYEMLTFKENPDYEDERIIALKFPVDFFADSVTDIVIEYDARLVYEPKSIYGTFNYILETGSHWKGNIGAGEISFIFPKDITETVFNEFNEEFTLNKNTLTWTFQNLEPDASSNINVSYSPELLNKWNLVDISVREIESSGDAIYTFSDESLPEGYSLQGFQYFIEGSPVYLFDSITNLDDKGWITTYSVEERPTIKLDLEGTFELKGFHIVSGIKLVGTSDTDSSTQSFYDILGTPKRLKLNFSDGTSTEVELENKPGEKQSISFDTIKTSFILFEVTDVYPSFNGSKEYMSIGRLKLNLGNLIPEIHNPSTVSSVTPIESKSSDQGFLEQNFILILVIFIGGIALISIFFIIYLITKTLSADRSLMIKEEKKKIKKDSKKQKQLETKEEPKPQAQPITEAKKTEVPKPEKEEQKKTQKSFLAFLGLKKAKTEPSDKEQKKELIEETPQKKTVKPLDKPYESPFGKTEEQPKKEEKKEKKDDKKEKKSFFSFLGRKEKTTQEKKDLKPEKEKTPQQDKKEVENLQTKVKSIPAKKVKLPETKPPVKKKEEKKTHPQKPVVKADKKKQVPQDTPQNDEDVIKSMNEILNN